ncbi:hypothetical protein [Marinimicrobium sp. LS-A18]|uniref:TA system antitoxin ParD family protein n=1 Tax=Marinimicrobium sp. LS-A18 TaxID=1381596 RepID=UPI0004634A78|nr:hypothetical protein [Marinimicrobium sp. LS-A18]
MAQQKPIRLNPELMRKAEQEAALEHRSVPRQIEYWASLGQLISRMMTSDQRLALMQGLVTLRLEESQPKDLSMDSILEELESDRQSGRLPGRVSEAPVRYGVDPDDPSKLVAYSAEGKRVVSGL